jgi:acetylornithine deacetylase/succinyl-diaminopimelate desuccinylase-like protein
MSTAWKEYIDTNKERFLEEMLELLRIPSVSAKSEHKADMQTCASLIQKRLLESGCDKAGIMPTAGAPIVYAEKLIDPAKPTVLVYGHYDVQPAEPFELWHNHPFQPEIREGKIFARGATDDKGQMYMHVKALETMVKTNSLPVNIKFLIEGEEEVSSANLEIFIKANKELLKADIILISDSTLLSTEQPSLEAGFRGISMIELEVTGANRDLHSGTYGGAVANPITILSQMIAGCLDENNHITIPGFYDDVREATDEDRKLLAAVPYNENEYKEDLGVKSLWGEKGFTTNERVGIRPTFELNGIWGGYTGEGAKTVLPSKAYAKISARLVPDQSSEDITKKMTDYFLAIAPPSVTVKVKAWSGAEPYMIDSGSKGYKAAFKAFETTFGKSALPVRDGGSLPLCFLMEKELGIKSVLMGFGLPDDNIHSPNEKFDLYCYFKGIETIPYFHYYFSNP